ncbi:MAG: MGMT family protein [Actinobacteria bacterium]|nr:MGMT family protein [Actinomycetota bacterium]MCI0678791.1 MGMT family protein [Actinomycetota bacterium]
MTVFEDAVIEVITGLAAGEVITYGEVAAEAGHPGAARAVGTLLARVDADLPWWRVVGAGGHLRSPNPGLQGRLLMEEGLAVVSGRVVLAQDRT